jgi:hypothetical protein
LRAALEIKMAYPDAFALKNSPFNAFLFSEVGLESNGSALTVLSTLARLGEDPWTQALSWARLPRPTIIDHLADRIRQMPLCPQALLDARSTASRLILLLPTHNGNVLRRNGNPAIGSTIPKELRLLIFYGALAIGMAVNLMAVSARQGSDAIPTEQTTPPQVAVPVAHVP